MVESAKPSADKVKRPVDHHEGRGGTEDGQGALDSVRFLTLPDVRDPVLLVSIGTLLTHHSPGSRMEAKQAAIRALWRAAEKLDASRFPHSAEETSGLILSKDSLGRPLLLVEGIPGPSVSFSHLADRTWAALNAGESRIGIDVASHGEFPSDYPIGRAFGASEFQVALEWAGGDRAEAAAMAWSIKESVVKALGCAFRLLDPLHVSLISLRAAESGCAFSVVVPHDRCKGGDGSDDALVSGLSFVDGAAWVSLAATLLSVEPSSKTPASSTRKSHESPGRFPHKR